LVAVFLIPLAVLRGGAQPHTPGSQAPGGGYGGIQHSENSAGAGSPADRELFSEERRLRAMNADRQKSMVSDARKLLQLVTELNAEIERDKPESLTPDEMRTLSIIEKLARNVKEKMSTSVRVPTVNPAMGPVMFP
jgi:hypothetical protein